MVGGEFSDIGNCNRPTGVACVGERWSEDESGCGVHVVQGSFWRGLGCAIACSKNLDGVRGRVPPVGALCVSTCVSKMPLAAALRVMLFRFCSCISSWSQSVRSVLFFCVLVCFCITMTRSGASPNGCLEFAGRRQACH